MNNNNSNLLDHFDINKILNTAKTALCSGFLGLSKYEIKSISLDDNSLLVYYVPKVENKIAIYSDICQIMSFLVSFMGEELKKMEIYSLGVKAMEGNKTSEDNMYIVSSIDVVKEIGKGNVIHWLKNSIVNEPISSQKEVLLLVEGSTETEAYPVLFKSMGYPIKACRIKMFPYSEHNLKAVLSILEFKKNYYYLVCDKDKSDEIKDLDREGYFDVGMYHILKNGEFEDYVKSEALVKILEKMDPGIGITTEYIEGNRKKCKPTSKIILAYYYQFGNEHVFPGKPKLGKEIAFFWAENGIPCEIEDIISSVMNIT